MSWSHVGKSQKNHFYAHTLKHPTTPPKNQRFKIHKRHSVSTTTKVITCALVIFILLSPAAAMYLHSTCTTLPSHYVSAKTNKPDMRGILMGTSYPPSFRVANLFMNFVGEFPSSFKMNQGVMDFMEVFVRRFDLTRTENYPDLIKAQVGVLLEPLSKQEKVKLAKALFDSYREMETSPEYQGCHWGSEMTLTGTCVIQLDDIILVTVDFVRSSSWHRKTYESTEQQAIFSFEGDKVYLEVVSHIQDETYDPKLQLVYEGVDELCR